jgi:TfoX/Sxy family transcriptional regulator of competence genes
MATEQSFMDFIIDQLAGVGGIYARKMFGEYAIYCHAKVVALVCDNQLFIKPTAGGRGYIGQVVEAPAYPGAKMSFLIEDKIENREWLCELVRITADEVPLPKPKIRKTKKA